MGALLAGVFCGVLNAKLGPDIVRKGFQSGHRYAAINVQASAKEVNYSNLYTKSRVENLRRRKMVMEG